MAADIAEPQGPQDRVGQGVVEAVAVGVALGALVERKDKTAQDAFSSRDQRMNVVTKTDPHGVLRLKRASAILKSSGLVILILYVFPVTTFTFSPIRSTIIASSVPRKPSWTDCSIARRKIS